MSIPTCPREPVSTVVDLTFGQVHLTTLIKFTNKIRCVCLSSDQSHVDAPTKVDQKQDTSLQIITSLSR